MEERAEFIYGIKPLPLKSGIDVSERIKAAVECRGENNKNSEV
jgi:hypothetical protein